MTSQTLPNWKPKTPTSYATPVLSEDATGGLSGTETPDRRGVLVWPFGSAVHFAVVDSVMDFVVDGVVPIGDIGTVVSTGGTLQGACVFSAIGQTFCLVNYNLSSTFYSRIYVANNPNVPTSWSLYATVYSAVAVDPSSFGSGYGPHKPLILDSGRWVLATTTENGTPFSVWSIRFFTSDDGGLTWDFRQWEEHFVFPAGRLEFASSEIGQDPATGYLYYRSGTSISSADMNIMWQSTNNGVTWNKGLSDLSGPRIIPFVDNGTILYGLNHYGSGVYAYDGSGVEVSDWVYTGENWMAPGATNDGNVSPYLHTTSAVTTRKGVFFFVRNQVMFTPAGPFFWVGYIGYA